MANREYPHDIEAERSLLGSMLISKDKCIDILLYLLKSIAMNAMKMIFMMTVIKQSLRQWLQSMKRALQ